THIPGIDRGSGILKTDSGLYHFGSAAAENAGVVYGTVVAAEILNDDFAKGLSRVSGSEVILVGDSVIGATLSAQQIPWRQLSEWEAKVPWDLKSHSINANGEAYVARAVVL